MKKVTDLLKRIQYNSPVILTFTLTAFAVLLLSLIADGWTTRNLFSVYRSSPTDPLLYIRLFGHVLGHANFEHFFGNFLLILLIGPMLEEKYGSKTMVILILFTALVTGILHVAFSEKALVGASGIVFMLILLSSFTNLKQGMIPVTLILVIFIFIGREAVDGFYKINGNVSYMTHILGGICGAAFGFALNKNKLISIKDNKDKDNKDDKNDKDEGNEQDVEDIG